MINTNTGGPAFPQSSVEQLASKFNVQGMTMRDYFAAKAMPQLMNAYDDIEAIAGTAYKMADAMLKAREP